MWPRVEIRADTVATADDLSVSAFRVRDVKQVVKVRMLPTEEQAAALRETLHACNEAASWLSDQMHAGGGER